MEKRKEESSLGEVVKVHIDDIRPGDVVLCHDDIERTVGRESITHDSFLGTRLWGYNYMGGHEPVFKVIVDRALPART